MSNDYSLLIVSDLHLSEGRDPFTGSVSRNEDFFFDDDFAAFLRYHQHFPGKWKLIINGDFVDFLQVASQPVRGTSSLSTDEIYGLKAGPSESVWKLGRIAQGHELVFESLGEFAVENRIVIISGNHDVEFFYPQVQAAFLKELESRVTSRQRHKVRGNVEFFPWFYLDGNLYVEHGHQYDSLNSFYYILDPRLPNASIVTATEQEHIDLPLGSLFVRYLFNRVELSTPFADNVKPATRFIGWFVTNHPLRALTFLLNEGREMLRRLKNKWHRVPESAFADRKASHEARLKRLAAAYAEQSGASTTDWVDRLGRLDDLRVPSLMRGSTPKRWRFLKLFLGPVLTPGLMLFLFLVAFAGSLLILEPLLERALPTLLLKSLNSLETPSEPWRSLFSETIRVLFLLELIFLGVWIHHLRRLRRDKSDWLTLRERARQIHGLMGVKYVVMGHSHEADLYDSNPDQHYFNTGTWTKVFGEEERVLREEKEFTFLRVTDTGPNRQARLMKWEGSSRAARLAYLFTRN